MSASTLDAAIEQLRRGRFVIAIPRGQKGLKRPGWQRERLTVEEAPRRFGNGENVGLLNGEPSGVEDVDLDSAEALAVADFFLPPTGMVHGRPSKPRSHRWYSASPIPKTRQWRDRDGSMLVELRSTGGQTLIPVSVHPSGEVYTWDSDGEPATADGAILQETAARVAAAALVARHWPAKGSRHEAAKAVAGFLLRGGCSEQETAAFLEAVILAANDEDGRARLADVRSTLKALDSDRPATGGPTLAELLTDGPWVVGRLSEWLGLRASRAVSADPCYTIEGGRLARVRHTKDGPVVDPLANFTAHVREEIVLDDGAEATRAFIIGGALDSGQPLPSVRVPAAQFAGMAWVTAQWGLRAVVRAGQSTRDYLREAIQRLSPDAPQRHVFTHTGWRDIGGEWVYLSGGGAVGREGFEVDLGPELARYRLPRQAEDPVGAMQASLRLLTVAPLTVTAPLWAGTFRAPLASLFPLDLAIWLEAQTGNLKSTLAALFLCHFGNFDRTHLSAAWSSTANQLERRAFILKDAVAVIDDYAPTALDARELEGKAAQLIRAQGNLAGRGRLRSDLTERPGFPPRGLIVSTGEQHPPGQSVLARTLLIEPRREAIRLDALGEAQRGAGRLPHAMTGYLTWLAPQLSALPAMLRETFEGARGRADESGPHLRVPEALAQLWLGLHCGLTFAAEVGACSRGEAEDLSGRCWAALVDLGKAQGRLVEEERPSRRFLRVLLTLVTQGRALLPARDASGDGWRLGVDLVGWQDEEALFLAPEAAHQAVSRFCRDAGEPFPVRRERLQKDLVLEGLAEAEDGRHTKTARVGGRIRRVLWLKRPAVAALLGEDFPPASPVVTGVTGSAE